MIERLALGTVQFGAAYGVANRSGQTTRREAATIISRAREAGMDTLDTAIAYGESEQRLGEVGVNDWRLVTKLPPLPGDVQDVRVWVSELLLGSLTRLGVPSVAGLLLHRSADLLGKHGAALASALRRERNEGRAAKIGVSIYDPNELDAIRPVLAPDLVQAPFSVIDRRLETSGWMGRLCDEGVELHTRSTFLQGLLTMPSRDRPRKFDAWAALWTEWSDWLEATGTSPVRAALEHALSYHEISRVLVGVETLAQLSEIVDQVTASAARAPLSLAADDTDLLNPSRWDSL